MPDTVLSRVRNYLCPRENLSVSLLPLSILGATLRRRP
jgi:hypothetical protein